MALEEYKRKRDFKQTPGAAPQVGQRLAAALCGAEASRHPAAL